jgi:radical SAM protein with 4Fe4S-binding SPASM domain
MTRPSCRHALTVVIQPDGTVYPCICASWPKIQLGNIYQDDFFEIINSHEARAFREQVHTGKYDLCRTEQCLPDFEPVTSQILDSIAASDYEIDHPRYYALNYDPTCNLVCPSCRPTKLTLHRNQRATVLEFQERLFESGALENATIHLTQEGDPFASQVYWRLLKKLNNERPVGIQLILQTNGLGLTPKVVRELENLHSAIGTISVSIDAATASTYAVVRGGNFELLLENLDNLHRVFVLPGKAKLILNFVLQTANYQDVPQFLDLARRLGASCFIGMIGNKCMSNEVYQTHAVFDWRHPEFHKFINMMRSKSVRDASHVCWTNLSFFAQPEREELSIGSVSRRMLASASQSALFRPLMSGAASQSTRLRRLLKLLSQSVVLKRMLASVRRFVLIRRLLPVPKKSELLQSLLRENQSQRRSAEIRNIREVKHADSSRSEVANK